MTTPAENKPLSWDSAWDSVFSTQEWGKYPSESLIQFVARNFYRRTSRAETKILEVGCGPGPNIWYLAREGFSAYGIDGSERAIQLANTRLHAEGLSAVLHVGDIISLPFPDSFFDAVVDVECLYANSRESTVRILKEIERCLKPGGLFYSRTLTDRMYVGKNQTQCGHMEYTDISDGPIAGKGFTRLMDRAEIDSLYRPSFDIVSIDRLEYSVNNEIQTISEWIIIGTKRENNA